MATHNDSSLYTGASSSSYGTSRKSLKAVNSQKRSELLPAADILIEEIDKDIAKLERTDFTTAKALIYGSDTNALSIEILAQEKALEHIKGLKQRLSNLLRDNKDTQ